jgi:hypothetical protein
MEFNSKHKELVTNNQKQSPFLLTPSFKAITTIFGGQAKFFWFKEATFHTPV